MADPQLTEYIKKAREAKQDDEQTKSLLLKNGWTDAEVAEAFAEIKPLQDTQVKIQKPEPVQQAQVAEMPQDMPKEMPQYKTMPRRKKSHALFATLVVLIILAAAGVGGYFGIYKTGLLKDISALFKKVDTQILPNQQQNPVKTQNSVSNSFGQYNLQTTKYTASLPEYEISLEDLSNLQNFENKNGGLSEDQKNALTENNFFITKNTDTSFYNSKLEGLASRNDDWSALYRTIGGSSLVWEREPENSVFITSDFMTHVYHKLIDEEFSYIEENNLYPVLNELSQSLFESSANAYSEETDQLQKDSYERLSAYFLVTSAILKNAEADFEKFQQQNFVDDSKADTKSAVLSNVELLAKANNVSDNAKNIARAEINLIFDAKVLSPSPLMAKYQPNMMEDYTQFGPRSHYAKNVILRNYFRAMMFYGRMNFLLKSPELTRDAKNITLLITDDQKNQWESIYQPTAFFVGQSDDLSISDYEKAIKKVGNSDITKLQNELLTYRNPQIMSSVIIGSSVPSTTKEDLQNTTKGFRFMGQRFTPDAFVFSSLTQGDELPDKKTGQNLPSMPTALMVSTLISGKSSSSLLDEWIKDNAPKSDKIIADRMTTLQQYFAKITPPQWTQNIYWSWLYTIKSLLADSLNKTGLPMFMKNQSWALKNLQAFLGSWTELKHDTLLYAKQSYAELGAGGPEEKPANPVVKGYVEPNIEFMDRLIALVNLTTDGLKNFGILPSNFESRNKTFAETVAFYRKIAVAELQNQKISDEDFEKLRLSAGQLDGILSAPDSQVQLESNARSALIADVHTDICGKDKTTGKCTGKSQILYEADGIPNYIYVAVSDANGTRLTKGLVYSYYEFTGPVGKRYTDQTWQGWNYSSSISKLQMPWWSKDLIK